MPWAVNTPGGQVRLMDLPLEVLGQIEVDTGTKWTDVLMAPAGSIKCALAVYAAACAQTESDPEQLTAARFVEDEVFTRVADDLPETYKDGLPKAEGEPPTSGSSGAPESTAGRRK